MRYADTYAPVTLNIQNRVVLNHGVIRIGQMDAIVMDVVAHDAAIVYTIKMYSKIIPVPRHRQPSDIYIIAMHVEDIVTCI